MKKEMRSSPKKEIKVIKDGVIYDGVLRTHSRDIPLIYYNDTFVNVSWETACCLHKNTGIIEL